MIETDKKDLTSEIDGKKNINNDLFKIELSSSRRVVALPITKDGYLLLSSDSEKRGGAEQLSLPTSELDKLVKSPAIAAKKVIEKEVRYTPSRLTSFSDTLHSDLYIGWDCSPIEGLGLGDFLSSGLVVKFHLLDWQDLLGHEGIDSESRLAISTLMEEINWAQLRETSDEITAAYIMGAYCSGSGMSLAGNPFRNTLDEHSEYSEWAKGWDYAKNGSKRH